MILADIKQDFYLNFIKDDRYMWLVDGLKTTLIITFLRLFWELSWDLSWRSSVPPTINQGILRFSTLFAACILP